jgi:hypothetical protein
VVGAFAIFGIGVVVEADGFPLAPEPYTVIQAEAERQGRDQDGNNVPQAGFMSQLPDGGRMRLRKREGLDLCFARISMTSLRH